MQSEAKQDLKRLMGHDVICLKDKLINSRRVFQSIMQGRKEASQTSQSRQADRIKADNWTSDGAMEYLGVAI